jgi:cation diffusion facilitator family transporter
VVIQPSPADEKSKVAITSVMAAIFLTTTKIVVGLMTGSLGILSEAAHSALDLVAAVVTVFAIKASARPADEDHPYGHGKVENLSALFETLLLLATCVWIIREAVERLFFHAVHVEANAWGFAVIVFSIIVDISRSRALMAAAKKHHSQALEADALHFSTDVWSSTVVLAGLGLVFLAGKFHLPWLAKADAIAALAVAAIVIWISIQLGRKTIHDLMDGVPNGLVQNARALVSGLPQVRAVRRLRVRHTGGEWFADVTVLVDPTVTLTEAHVVADAVEAGLAELIPGSDVVVHTEPFLGNDQDDASSKLEAAGTLSRP